MSEQVSAQPATDEAAISDGDEQAPRSRRGLKLALVAGVVLIGILSAIWFYNYWTIGRFLESTTMLMFRQTRWSFLPRLADMWRKFS